MSISTVVLGGAGYVGGELLRLIHAHPRFELAAAVSGSYANAPVGSVFPHLACAAGSVNFTPPDDWSSSIAHGSDVALFSAAPHGASAAAVAAALDVAEEKSFNVHVVDSSADFRYANASEFADVYGIDHPAPGLTSEFSCAVPEHAADSGAPHAGHPGCFATAALLAAVPLVKSGLTNDELFLTGITGSTGSGRSAKAGTHHPERHSNLYAYQALRHRHTPEIAGLVEKACGTRPTIHFVPHSGPFARGIYMTLQASLRPGVSEKEIAAAFGGCYAGSPFVRIVAEAPRLKDVVASNYCHIGFAANNGAVTVMCVIDNLVKGAAGGAMQWMNRLWSLPQETGLLAAPPAWT
ncbi:MAG: N-acetyl-gamma-glutamyl-phosphate reductase [Pseudomonadota bacterium]